MEKILELCDSYNSTYPEHFQVFLNNCIKTYAENFGANDYLFAAVYFIILETGFSPIELTDVIKKNSTNFDIRKLCCVTSYADGHIRISKNIDKSKYFFYQIPLTLGNYRYV